jgi:hypothetical protein
MEVRLAHCKGRRGLAEQWRNTSLGTVFNDVQGKDDLLPIGPTRQKARSKT